ncbi:MAG: hypothetical protein JKY50_02595 [Oleispira sp.]|nr:hypothetical protein [Oleispira sp.]MBL4879998.1 hypothetical protein [Oleispira sp.]
MDENVKKKQPNKPFKQTKQLLKLALNDGWTQIDIGKECRVSQPVISHWKTGIALAKEHQIQTLLEQYGHILRRKTFKVYWVVDGNTQENSYVKVEGKVIFSYSLRKIEYSKPGAPVVKIIVHHQGNDKFRLVSQSRSKNGNNENLHCMDEEAKWISSIKDQYTLSGLINLIDIMPKDDSFIFLPDAKALPFLIRKALLNHGFSVEDVVDYPASW